MMYNIFLAPEPSKRECKCMGMTQTPLLLTRTHTGSPNLPKAQLANLQRAEM